MKHSIIRIAALAACVVIAGPALAKEAPPPGGTPKDLVLAEPTRFDLDNGLQATLLAFGTAPKATVYVSIRTGGLDEDGRTWLSSITSELLKEGTENYTALELAQKAAAMGGGISVASGDESTTVVLDVLSENAAEAVALVAEVIRRPTFPASEIERIQRDHLRSLAVAKQQAQSQAGQAFGKLMYGDHPYGGDWPSEELISGYTIEDASGFYEANYGAKRTRVYVAGRFDAAGVEQAVREQFGDWKPGPDATIDIPAPPESPGVVLIDRPQSPQATINLGLKTIDPSDPEWTKLVFTNTLLGGFFSSRIIANIREDKGYSYSPRSSISPHYRDAYWAQSADVSIEHTGDSLREVYFEIDRLRSAPPGEDEVERVRNYTVGSFILSNASRTGVLSQIAYIDFHGLPQEYLTQYAERVSSVTAQDVTSMAQKYLVPEDMSLVVVGDLSQVRPQLEALPQLEGRLPD